MADETPIDTFEEIWRPISGFEDKYFVSSFGRIKNRKGLIMKATLDRYGYERIHLRKNGRKYSYLVHRLVAKEFIQSDTKKTQVNHKDGNKTNNCVSNLEYVTPKENMWHKIYVLENRHTLLKKVCPIKCLETGVSYPSIREASRKCNIDSAIMCKCLAEGRADRDGHHWVKMILY